MPDNITAVDELVQAIENHVKAAIHKNKLWGLTRGMWLQHDNTCPQTADCMLEMVQEIRFKVLPDPPCLPDLQRVGI